MDHGQAGGKDIYVFLHYCGKHISGKYIMCHSVSRKKKKNIYIYIYSWISFLSSLGSFLSGSNGKEFACNLGDLGSIPGSGRFPGRGNGN